MQLLLSIVLSYQYPPSEFFLFGVGCRNAPSQVFDLCRFARILANCRFKEF
ncbi:hypothetical protein PARMER_02884 [Parabacteroides merdae ATCC 43184]|nr:hypothetical protein PARMER_02884 [Parabacteroides merdae ATCC 43184]